MSTISASSLLAGASSSSSINLSSLLQAATGATSSGIDVSSAVAAAIYAAQGPERQWQAQQSIIKSQITSLTSLQTALSTLSTDLNNLGDITGPAAARTVTTSAPNVLTGSASPGAAIGTHTVTVSALATTASWYSPALASASGMLGTSTLSLTRADGQQFTFPAGAGVNTLADMAAAINASSAGINASVVTDASGARLALVGKNSGAANDFTATFSSSAAPTWTSAAVPSAATPLPSGTLQLSDGASSAAITISAGDTLTDLAAHVNASGLNVTATVVTDTTGAHLQLNSPGAAVSVGADPTFRFTRASTGANAALTLDGIPISSATNTVKGAVDGLTLTLTGVSTTPLSIGVAADTAAMTSSLSSFVADYNAALDQVNSQFAFDSSSGSQGVLAGDTAVRSLQSALLGLTSYNGSAGSSGGITSLAGLGITMGDDGRLALDTTKLAAAMAQPAAVQSFLQGAALNGFAQTANAAIKIFSSAGSGTLAGEISQLNAQYSGLQGHVDDYESGYIAAQRTVLTAMYSKAEIALQQLPTQIKQIQAQLGNNSGS